MLVEEYASIAFEHSYEINCVKFAANEIAVDFPEDMPRKVCNAIIREELPAAIELYVGKQARSRYESLSTTTREVVLEEALNKQ